MEDDNTVENVSNDNFIQVVNTAASSGFGALNVANPHGQQALLQVLSTVAAAVKTEHTKHSADGDIVGVSSSNDSSQVTVYNANNDVAVFRKNEHDQSASQEVCFNLQCDAFASETVVTTSDPIDSSLVPVLDPVLMYSSLTNRAHTQQTGEGMARPLFLPVQIGPQQKPDMHVIGRVCDVMFLTSIKDIVLRRLPSEKPDPVFWLGKPTDEPRLSDPKLMCVTDKETRIQFYSAIERTCIKRFTMGNDVIFYITVSFNEFIYINLLQTLYELKHFGKILPLGRKDNSCNIRLLAESTNNDSLEQDLFLEHLKRIPDKATSSVVRKAVVRVKNTARKSMRSAQNKPVKQNAIASPVSSDHSTSADWKPDVASCRVRKRGRPSKESHSAAHPSLSKLSKTVEPDQSIREAARAKTDPVKCHTTSPIRSTRRVILKPEYADYLRTLKSKHRDNSADEDDIEDTSEKSDVLPMKTVLLNQADNSVSHPVKRGRGRPRKYVAPQSEFVLQQQPVTEITPSSTDSPDTSQPSHEQEKSPSNVIQMNANIKLEVSDKKSGEEQALSGLKKTAPIKPELKEKYKNVLCLDSLNPEAGMWKNVSQLCPTALLTKARTNAKKFACLDCLMVHTKGSTGACNITEPRHTVSNPDTAENCNLQSICSIPSPLCLRLSPQFNKLMVYSFSPIEKYTQFGPLVGILMTETDITVDIDMSHLWFLRYDEDGERYFLYTAEENASNWCRYLQTVFKEDYNTALVLKEDGIFFVSTRDIEPGEMIRVYVPYFGNRERPLAMEMDFSNCVTCHKEFASPVDFQKHWHIFHPYGLVKRKERCSLCQKVFPSLRDYEKHCKEMHAGQGGVRCDICDQFFYQKHKLKQHKWNCHPPPEAAVDCPKCGKTFKNSFSLRNHVQNAHSTMTFTCTTCNKVFTKKMTLLRHMKLHTETFKFFCDHCNKGFYNAWNLKVHMAVHTDEKPFICEMSGCKRGFASKKIIKDHYRKEHGLTDPEMPNIYRRALIIDKKVPRQRRPYANHRRPATQFRNKLDGDALVTDTGTTIAEGETIVSPTTAEEFHIIQDGGSGEVVMADDIITEGHIVDGDVVLDSSDADGNIVTVMLEDDIMTEQVVQTEEQLVGQSIGGDHPDSYISLQIGDQEVLVPGGGGQVVIYQTEPEG